MSKMSRLNLQIQEQAEEMGFSTVQEAIDNGYHVVEDLVASEATLKKLSIDEQYEHAHEAWLKERDILVHEVEMLINDTPYQVYKDTLRKVVEFLKGVKHE